MTKKNITTMALSMVLVLAVAGFAAAGPGYGRGACGGQGPRGLYSQLTPEKQVAVDKIVESYRPKFDEVRTSLQAKHAVLQAMINGGQADEKKITKLTQDINTLRDRMVDLNKAMRDELTKETGLEMGVGRGFGPGNGQGLNCGGPGSGPDNCPGYSQGRGQRGGGPRWQ